ncbi:MAG TPA: hypothetical protein VEF33_10550 [Syntrophales bacterium]|nr:hypothetical protein [Syntrophales bacterium]
MIGEEIIARYQILKKLVELDYRIDKMKKMVMELDGKNLMRVNEDEYIDRDVSSFFFLR